MCQIIQKQKKFKDGIDLNIICSISGKPINISNHYGMFCEDMCELEACKIAEKKLESFIKMFFGIFP